MQVHNLLGDERLQCLLYLHQPNVFIRFRGRVHVQKSMRYHGGNTQQIEFLFSRSFRVTLSLPAACRRAIAFILHKGPSLPRSRRQQVATMQDLAKKIKPLDAALQKCLQQFHPCRCACSTKESNPKTLESAPSMKALCACSAMFSNTMMSACHETL